MNGLDWLVRQALDATPQPKEPGVEEAEEIDEEVWRAIRPKDVTPELRAQILDDLASGRSIAWIIVNRSVTRPTVRKIRDAEKEHRKE